MTERPGEARDGALRGLHVTRRVLARDAELEGVATRRRDRADALAAGDADLLGNEVKPGDLLGDRVLHLQARIDLEEEDLIAHQELARAEADEAGTLEQGARPSLEGRLLLGCQARRGCLFDEFLIAALDRAVARGDDREVAAGIAHALGLHVPRIFEVLFNEDALRGGTGSFKEVVEVVVFPNDGDATPAAAVGLLRHDRVTPAGHEVLNFSSARDLLRDSGHWLDAHPLGQLARADLVPERT